MTTTAQTIANKPQTPVAIWSVHESRLGDEINEYFRKIIGNNSN